MDTSYLYSYNAERYQKLAERKLPCREKLNTTEVEQGYLLPNRFAKTVCLVVEECSMRKKLCESI